MSEEKTTDLNGPSTDPLPFEEMVKRQFEMLQTRFDRLEQGITERFAEQSAQIAQQSAQIAQLLEGQTRLGARMSRLEEKFDIQDWKVGAFVREQLLLKRDLEEAQESLGLRRPAPVG